MKLSTKKINSQTKFKNFLSQKKKIKFKIEYFIPIILILITLPLLNRLFTPKNELKYLYIAENMIKSGNPFVYFVNGEYLTSFFLINIFRN